MKLLKDRFSEQAIDRFENAVRRLAQKVAAPSHINKNLDYEKSNLELEFGHLLAILESATAKKDLGATSPRQLLLSYKTVVRKEEWVLESSRRQRMSSRQRGVEVSKQRALILALLRDESIAAA